MVRKKFSGNELVFGALAGLLTILILTFYLWHITENIRLGYDIGQAENKKENLRDDIKKLETKKASLSSLERVEKKAREELKLADPRDDQIVYEDDGRNRIP
jgi:cell division protein FtsL